MTQAPGDIGSAAAVAGFRRTPLRPFDFIVTGARTMEIDLRLAGLLLTLICIWLGFGWASNGLFMTPRNFYDVSVQSVPVAIMATGMVLVIVSRNIDLSVGSIMGLTAYLAAMTQRVWLTENLHIPTASPEIWIIALLVALVIGALIGGLQGSLVAYVGVPSFIVTLGGLLIWRGLIFKIQQGQTIAPMDKNFAILGGNLSAGSAISASGGAIGFWPTWIVGLLLCVGIVYALISSRRKRREYGFPVRPRWALWILIIGGCATVLAAMYVYNSYPLPILLTQRYATDHGLDPNGLVIPVGLAAPVLILLAVALMMGYLTTRRQFGRYVFAIGGNPEAATLAGINTRRTIVGTFVLLGMLCALAGCLQASRLDAGVTSTGTTYELLVIAAAVIGGTSFAGGIGTIQGAVVGAFLMQSLKAGMVTIGWDSPLQDVAVGTVLIIAVGLDTLARSGKLSQTVTEQPIAVLVPEAREINRGWGVPGLGMLARAILVIPHLVVLAVLQLLVLLGLFFAVWIPILVNRKVPVLWCRLVGEVVNRSARVGAYTLLVPGAYPALQMGANGPVHFELNIGDRTIRRRWGIPVVGALVRSVFLIPHLIVAAVLGIALVVLMLVVWIPILVRGRYPQRILHFVGFYLTYTARVSGYASMLPVPYPPIAE